MTLCPGAFYDQNAPKFELFYAAVAAGLPTKKVCTVESPFIRSTEHVVDENTRYVFLINYDRVPHTARLSVSGAYAIEIVWGKGYNGTSAAIPANDGLLLRLTK